jgi:uncharacterized protein YjbI with pentapeptide repeats
MADRVFDGSRVNGTEKLSDIENLILKTRSCVNCDFRNNNLLRKIFGKLPKSYRELEDWNFQGSTFPVAVHNGFRGCNLKDTNFENSGDFHNRGFVRCNLENANMKQIEIDQSGIINCNCTNADLTEARIRRDTKLTGSNFTNTNFTDANFDTVTLDKNILTNTNFSNARFKNLIVEGSRFNHTNFTNATICKINTKVFMTGCILKGTKIENINGATFTGMFLGLKLALSNIIK